MNEKSNIIRIDDTDYDMDTYPYVCLAKTSTMACPLLYMLIFVRDTNHMFSEPNVSIEIDGMPDKEELYQKVSQYLKKHPQKKIGFDGCCFHYPKPQGLKGAQPQRTTDRDELSGESEDDNE